MPERHRTHWTHWLIAIVVTIGLGGLSAAEQLAPSAPIDHAEAPNPR